MSVANVNEDGFSNSEKPETSNKVLRVEDMDDDTVCGFWIFRPQWLQQWATPRMFVIFYTLTGVLQSMLYPSLIGNLSSLEKRYAFNTKTSGAILTMDEILPSVLGIIIGYVGGRVNRPRLLSMGMISAVLCCFLAALPYFLYGANPNIVASTNRNDTGAGYCGAVRENCEIDERQPTIIAVGCLFLAYFFKGFTNISYFVVGVSFLDDSAKKKNTPIYFGLSMSLRMFGPIISYSMSSTFLRYYEDPTVNPNFGPDDPRWVGAWWMGYVIQGFIFIVVTIPLFLFPKRLPSQRKIVHQNADQLGLKDIKNTVLGLFISLVKLFKSPIYFWFCLGTILNPIFFYSNMLPKYIESQFFLSSSTANILSGTPSNIAFQIATFLNGVIIWKLRPTASQLLGATTITQIILTITYLALMLPSCKSRFDDGTHFENGLTLINECNAECNCSTSVMMPVCGSDGISTYFSSCFAGCTVSTFENNEQRFGNCSCLRDTNGEFQFSPSVDNGYCLDEDCKSMLTVYIVGTVSIFIMGSIFTVAQELLILRSVESKDKSMAIGTFEAISSTIGFIPIPLIYGAFIDSSCLIWESSCGETGNCWIYDSNRFRKVLHGLTAALAVGSTLCFAYVWRRASEFQPMYDDPEDIELETKKNAEETITKETNVRQA